MPTLTKTFIYTGTTQNLVVPAGTTSITLHLWGGGGGGGGGDSAGPGRSGAAGHYLLHTDFSMSSFIGKTMSVAVGGGGGGGQSGGNAPGGANGRSLTGYSGGTGGESGPNGSSGAGGGGGGATLIAMDGGHQHIAAGGGGGAGDGQHGRGTVGINTTSATSNTPGTLGENGADHTGDGGGGGAGGGGFTGGKGGAGASGDNGGAGGWSGLNLAQVGSTTSDVGSGTAPAGTGVSGYQADVAGGGSAKHTGGNGLALITFTIGVQAHINVSGTWKETTNVYTKVSGTWKEITAAYTRVSGAWKALFNSGVDFNQTAAGFGDASGGTTSGAAGSGGGGGGRVICTWLQNKGMFSLDDLLVDQQFSIKYLGRTTKIGYWFWAVPLVEYMTKTSKSGNWFGAYVIETIRILAQSRANELAYKMGVRKKRDVLGIFTRVIGESFCWSIGFIVRPFVEERFGEWIEIYDPDIN